MSDNKNKIQKTFRLNPTLLNRVIKICDKHEITYTQFLEEALDEKLLEGGHYKTSALEPARSVS